MGCGADSVLYGAVYLTKDVPKKTLGADKPLSQAPEILPNCKDECNRHL